MEQEWASNPSPEVIVSVYATEDQEITHKTKGGGQPDPMRVHMMEYQMEPDPKAISNWTWKCPYGSQAFPHYLLSAQKSMAMDIGEPSLLLAHSATCVLENIPDDIFFTLATYLPSETVLIFSEAYPRFRTIVESAHELLRRELQCFFLTPLTSSILGIGVAWDPRQRTLTSDFDWLSEEAFMKFGVRRSIQKRAFQYFLPLAFSRLHFLRVQDKILGALLVIYRDEQQVDGASLQRTQGASLFRQPETLNVLPSELLLVIYRMMNNIVVALMKSCDDVLTTRNGASSTTTLLLASEKAVYSYCHLFHLLLCLSRSNPNIQQDATKKISDFITQPGTRVKASIPDLGEFIVLVTLALASGKGDVSWSILNGPFLEEAIVRNAR